MKSASFLFVVVLTLSCVSEIKASASLVEFPKSIRQTYSDGTFTEVECTYPPAAPHSAQCEFRVGREDHVQSYSFRLADYGYGAANVLSDYSYWNYWSYDKQQPFVVAFKVDCGSEDIKLIPGATQDNLVCRIFLRPNGDGLVAQRVEISTLVGGRREYREIPGRDP